MSSVVEKLNYKVVIDGDNSCIEKTDWEVGKYDVLYEVSEVFEFFRDAKFRILHLFSDDRLDLKREFSKMKEYDLL